MRRFGFEDALGLVVPVQETISPDGTRAAWVERAIAEDDMEPRLALCTIDTGSPEHVAAREPAEPRWAPDGGALAFTARGPDGRSQLCALEPGSSEPRAIATTDGLFTSPQWRPGRGTIAAVHFDVPRIEPNGGPPIPGSLTGVFPRPGPRGRLVEVDAGSGTLTELIGRDRHVWGYRFSPDGERVAYMHSPAREWQDITMSLARIAILDLETGTEVSPPADVRITSYTVATLTWSPDGRRVAFMGGDGDDAFGGNTYFVLDAATASVVTRHVDEESTVVGLDWIGPDEVAVLRVEGVRSAFYTARADLSGARLLTAGPDGETGSFNYELAAWPPQPLRYTLSAPTGRICTLWSNGARPPEIWGGPVASMRRLSHVNAKLDAREYPEVRRLEWESHGLRIEGLFVTPLDAGSGPWPTFVHLHGGPAEAWEDRFCGNWYTWATVLAGRGIATLMPNPRGSIGRGASFQNIYGRWMREDADDILSGIDHAVAEGLTDGDRVSVGGWSYGGYATAWLITETDRFAAAMVGAGFANMTSEYLTSDNPMFEGPASLGKPFHEDPDLYWERSAVRRMGGVTTPTLILHSELDLRIPVTEAWSIYRALDDAGVDVELVVYPGEGHQMMTRDSQEDGLRRGVRFLERHLLPEREQ